MKLAVLFGLYCLFAGAANAAGFDCSKAGSADEKIVCADVRLSHLDDLFNQRYVAARHASQDSDTVHTARNFLADRHDCKDDKGCILSAYLAVLWDISEDKNDFMQGISAQLLLDGGATKASKIPTKIGQCSSTSVLAVHPRVGTPGIAFTDADYDIGTGIDYANNGYQVSYNREKALIGSKPGDPVSMCLVEIDRDCKPGDSGRLYLVTNNRTRQSWILPDAQHKCGG